MSKLKIHSFSLTTWFFNSSDTSFVEQLMLHWGTNDSQNATCLATLWYGDPGIDTTGRRGVLFLCTLAKPYNLGGWLPIGFSLLNNCSLILLSFLNSLSVSMILSSSFKIGFLALLLVFSSFSNCSRFRIGISLSWYDFIGMTQKPIPLSNGTAINSLFFRNCLVSFMWFGTFCFLHFLI